MRFVILVCLIVAPQLPAAAEDDAEVREKLVGVWKGRVLDGATGHELTFTSDSISGLKDGTRELGKGSFTLDLTTKPWTMDAVEIKEDGKTGRTWLGIVSLERNSLKWCVGAKARPAKFATGDGSFYLVLKRQKGSVRSESPAKPGQPTPPAQTGNCTVAELAEPAPEVFSAEVRKTLRESGLRITGPSGMLLADIWLRSNVPAFETSKPESETSEPESETNEPASETDEQTDQKYPFELGALFGAMRISEHNAGDFRKLAIAPGVYTLRYAPQPADDAHEHTKQFRDFVVLLSASDDTNPDSISDAKELSKRGIDTTGEPHPAIMYLKAPQRRRQDLPAMVRIPATGSNTDLHVLITRTLTEEKSGGRKIQQIELVIAGYAKE